METITDSSLQSGGRWYKFDDDLVTPADRREAVEMCYGSGYTQGNIPRSGDYSSAYMLVYIRETEAPHVVVLPTAVASLFSVIIGNARSTRSNGIVKPFVSRKDEKN